MRPRYSLPDDKLSSDLLGPLRDPGWECECECGWELRFEYDADALGEDTFEENDRLCVGCENGSSEDDSPIRLSTDSPSCTTPDP